MNRSLRARVLGTAFILLAFPAFAQIPVSRGWTIVFADGRSVTNVLRPKGGLWTPRFPRVAGADVTHNGLPLYVLDVAYLADGDDVAATVTLVYGQFQDRVTVAHVRVTSTRSAVINELKPYGVEPITLAIVPLERTLALPFVAEEPSGQLEIRIDAVGLDTALYRIVVNNHSARDLRAIDYRIYEGDRLLASGRRKTERNEPLVRSGAEYSFEYWTSQSAGQPARTPDHMVVTSVMWDDGTVDGDDAGAAQERVMARNRGPQLKRLLGVLGDGPALSIPALRSAFLALDRTDYALERARSEALAELEQLERDGDMTAVERWITSKQAELFAWLTRVDRVLR